MILLRELLAGGTLRLMLHFLLRPEQRLHFRALQQQTGLGTGALQRELARFQELGLITRMDEGAKAFYQAVADHPSWGAFRTLVREHGDPAEVVREALRDVPGIRAAFVFGSTVRGNARPDSDVDVLIVQEGMSLADLGRALTEAQSLLTRLIDVKLYTPAALQTKLRQRHYFIQDVLSSPKTWLIGSEEAIATH